MNTTPNNVSNSSLLSIPSTKFWELIAEPCIKDFSGDPNSIKSLIVAIWAIDAMVSHLYWGSKPENEKADEYSYFNQVIEQVPSFESIREASNCLKHAKRTDKKSLTAGSADVQIRKKGWGEAEFGADGYGGGETPLLHKR